jgi:hypothetical protein
LVDLLWAGFVVAAGVFEAAGGGAGAGVVSEGVVFVGAGDGAGVVDDAGDRAGGVDEVVVVAAGAVAEEAALVVAGEVGRC